jgi:hypothetical protein
MTSSETLIKKEFNIKSQDELYKFIELKPEEFFKENFFTDKITYLNMLKSLVLSINRDGADYSNYMSMAKSGSIFSSPYTSEAISAIKMEYQANRKKLVNHVRFFVK